MNFLDLFVAVSSAVVVVFGFFVGVLGSMLRGYKDARTKGEDPLIHAIFSGFVGFFTTAVIITLLFAFLQFVGFRVSYNVCLFFESENYCSQHYGGGQ